MQHERGLFCFLCPISFWATQLTWPLCMCAYLRAQPSLFLRVCPHASPLLPPQPYTVPAQWFHFWFLAGFIFHSFKQSEKKILSPTAHTKKELRKYELNLVKNERKEGRKGAREGELCSWEWPATSGHQAQRF